MKQLFLLTFSILSLQLCAQNPPTPEWLQGEYTCNLGDTLFYDYELSDHKTKITNTFNNRKYSSKWKSYYTDSALYVVPHPLEQSKYEITAVEGDTLTVALYFVNPSKKELQKGKLNGAPSWRFIRYETWIRKD